MMRAALIVAGLVLGLAVAVCSQGRIEHLDLFGLSDRPAGLSRLRPDAGLLAGQAYPVAMFPAELRVVPGYRLRRLSLSGPVYDVTLTANGLSLRGTARVPWRGGPLRLSLTGPATPASLASLVSQPPRTADLADRADNSAATNRTGRFGLRGQITDLDLVLDLAADSLLLTPVSGSVTWRDPGLADMDPPDMDLPDMRLPDMRLTITADPADLQWRVILAPDGVAAPQGPWIDLRGPHLDDASLAVHTGSGGGWPDAVLDWLDANGTQTEPGLWKIDEPRNIQRLILPGGSDG